MFVLAGLGNPGTQYALNRHNIGFIVLDKLAQLYDFPVFLPKFKGLVSQKTIREKKITLLKPMTHMNLSGQSIGALLSFFKLEPADLCVIHDDIDLSPYTLKIKQGRGDGGHNGLTDITRTIGSDYIRLRLGVGRPEQKGDVKDYVLSNFFKHEHTDLISWIEKIVIAIMNSLENRDFMGSFQRAYRETIS